MRNVILFLLISLVAFCLPQPLRATPQVSISPQKKNTAIVIPKIKGLIAVGVGVTILGMEALKDKIKVAFGTNKADVLFATSDGNIFLPNNEDKANLHKQQANNRTERANKAKGLDTKPEQLLQVHKFERKDFVKIESPNVQEVKKGKTLLSKEDLKKKVMEAFGTQKTDVLFATSDGNLFLSNNEDKAKLHKQQTNNRIEQANKANGLDTKPEELLEVYKFERKDFKVETTPRGVQENKKTKAPATKKMEADTEQQNGEVGEVTGETPDENQPNGEGEK